MLDTVRGHSRLPWRYERSRIGECRIFAPVAHADFDVQPAVVYSEPDAALIVQAVNSHDKEKLALALEVRDLRSALEGLLEIASVWATLDGGKNIDLNASDTVKRAQAVLSATPGHEDHVKRGM